LAILSMSSASLPRIKNFLTFSTIHAELTPDQAARKNNDRRIEVSTIPCSYSLSRPAGSLAITRNEFHLSATKTTATLSS